MREWSCATRWSSLRIGGIAPGLLSWLWKGASSVPAFIERRSLACTGALGRQETDSQDIVDVPFSSACAGSSGRSRGRARAPLPICHACAGPLADGLHPPCLGGRSLACAGVWPGKDGRRVRHHALSRVRGNGLVARVSWTCWQAMLSRACAGTTLASALQLVHRAEAMLSRACAGTTWRT